MHTDLIQVVRFSLGFIFVLLTAGISAQVQDGILDLRASVQRLTNKSSESKPQALMALPVLKKASSRSLPIVETNGVLNGTILMGAGTRSYVLLQDVRLGFNESVLIEDNDNHRWIFSQEEVSKLGRLIAGPLVGDARITYIGSNDEQQVPFRLKQVYIVSEENRGAVELGFGASYECQININCDEGMDYQDEKNGVMRIRMVAEEGVALCTGTLMNNVREDGDPIVLTAYHCLRPGEGSLTPLFDMWFFDFNYEGLSCANPEKEPGVLALQGAEVLAEWEDTDMMLLRIEEEIPVTSNIYFNGWDRRESHQPLKSVIIHHPSGDIKKITTDYDKVVPFDKSIAWNNGTVTPSFTHYINDFDDAVYQPGSSGAGLFDDTGKVIGQLHGGPLSDEFCTIGIGYSGRLSQSWESGVKDEERLQPWLDPDNTGVQSLDGVPANSQSQVVMFEGTLVTSTGFAIPRVRVTLSGDKEASLLTGSDGRFVFENLSTLGNYTITFSKDGNAGNGLSAIDLIKIQNHILGRELIQDVFARFAADVNKDDKISSIDLVQIINVLVGESIDFPDSDSWNFEPKEIQIRGNNVGAGSIQVNIVGYKMGDTNNSANPRL